MNMLLDPRLVYLCVFLAIVLPVVLWHREERIDSDTRGGLDRLPSLFKLFWNVAGALEFPFGNPVARILKGTSDKYRKMIPLKMGYIPVPEDEYKFVRQILGDCLWLPAK